MSRKMVEKCFWFWRQKNKRCCIVDGQHLNAIAAITIAITTRRIINNWLNFTTQSMTKHWRQLPLWSTLGQLQRTEEFSFENGTKYIEVEGAPGVPICWLYMVSTRKSQHCKMFAEAIVITIDHKSCQKWLLRLMLLLLLIVVFVVFILCGAFPPLVAKWN